MRWSWLLTILSTYIVLWARFVDSHKDIREEFLTFLLLERITGEQIADEIISFLTENGIPVTDIQGQGYDGTSNMSSSRVGVQQRIKHVSPLAMYVHCSGHCLNLVLTKLCSLPDVRNVIERLRKCNHWASMFHYDDLQQHKRNAKHNVYNNYS